MAQVERMMVMLRMMEDDAGRLRVREKGEDYGRLGELLGCCC